MFLGHYAIALAAKPAMPRRSVGWSFLAAQLLDILWAAFVLGGLEHMRIVPHILPASSLVLYDIPWSHGLVMALVWGWFCFRFTKSIVLALCVISHWVLDFIVHTPDLPVWRGGAVLGLGLWRYREATVAVELLMFAIGLWIYMRSTRPRNTLGRTGMPALAVFLTVTFLMNTYGPPPPSVRALTMGGEISFLLLAAVAALVDRGREPRPGAALSIAE